MTVLCEWFPRCEEVEKLYLQNNAFTATGWDLPRWGGRARCQS